MSLRAADLLFALPRPVTTVRTLQCAPDLAAGLQTAGYQVVGTAEAGQPVDLVIAPASRIAQAVGLGADLCLLFGGADGEALRRAGLRSSRLLLHGLPAHPELILPLGSRRSVRYVGQQLLPRSAVLGLREKAFLAAASAGLPADRLTHRRTVLTVAARESPRPYLLNEIRPPAAPDTAWFMTLGQGDDLQRAVLHVFDGGSRPQRVVKFSRVPGYRVPFDRDRRGLAQAANAGPRTRAHAPQWLGEVAVGGRHGSVESAAPGRQLHELLTPSAGHGTERLVGEIAAWILAMGEETATPPGALADERRRLDTQVLPAWSSREVPRDLVTGLPPVPGVLQHNDLGSWNVITDGAHFTAVDWESARAPGLPLWDLLYFLADALARLDGPAPGGDLTAAVLRLFRGDSPRSPVLFGWVRAGVASLGLPASAVGRIATLGWMHHGLSAGARQVALDAASAQQGPGRAAPLGHLERLAAPWLADPLLGPGWTAWQR